MEGVAADEWGAAGGAGPDGELGDRSEHFVQSLERGLAVVKAFSSEAPELTLSGVARRTGLPRAAVRRFLLTLVELGYVGVHDRRFHLRPRVLELGFAYLSSLSLPEISQPHMARLSDSVQESTSVAVLDGEDVVYVARVAARRIMAAGIGVGTRLPAYLTSHGRVLLAALPPTELDRYLDVVRLEARTSRTVTSTDQLRARLDRARSQGWCLIDQELEEGVTSIAAPLRGATGEVVASLNVATHSSRRGPVDLQEHALTPLLETAALIEKDLRMAGICPPSSRPRQ